MFDFFLFFHLDKYSEQAKNRNRQKILSSIQQRFSCLLDEWIAKICKYFFSQWLFFKSTLSVLRCKLTGWINLKILV
jgi:hypothetical protein